MNIGPSPRQNPTNLETGQAVCRVERSDYDFNLSVPFLPSPEAAAAAARRDEVVTVSREKYGTARADVEAMLARSRGMVPPPEPPSSPPPKPVAKTPKAAEVPKAEAVPPIVETPPPVVAVIPKPKPQPPDPKAAEVPPVPQASELTEVAEKPKLPVPKQNPPRDLGRGGAQHKAIQQRLKAEAEKMGFLATIEKEIPNGGIDLLVERQGCAIACEISVTTTIDHEVGNVQKCIQAGFAQVAIICQEDVRSQKIREAVISSLGSEAAEYVTCFRPDEFSCI